MKVENPKEIYLEPNIYPSNMERQWCEDDVFSEHDYEGCASVRYVIADDTRLNDNFETALTALIEHHGADALTALAAVMRHYDLTITGCIDSFVSIQKGPDLEWLHEGQFITANDIKPEK